MTTTTTKSSDLRIGENIKKKLRRMYSEKATKSMSPDQQTALAINTIADLDPMDRLDLSSPDEEERLQKMINYMIR
ncbi:hypothetical protein EBX31_02910 [bacterium]|nr:hypothetical protein [bacterium]